MKNQEQTARKQEVTKKKSNSKTGSTSQAAPVRSTGAASVSKQTKTTKASKETKVVKAAPLVPVQPKPNVRYNDKDLEMFKVNIEHSKSDALEELRMLRERLDDLTSSEMAEESAIYSMHMAEQGSEAMEKEKTYAQIQRIQEYIRKLDEALMRIDEKTYGICRMCGIKIAKERLLAVPITTLSASYKIHQQCPEDGVDRIVAKPGGVIR
ncbi:MAG: TraR/DksA C4-type zinc finger protein [Candidatus Kapaibacterium sp.]|nr:TraR/DksA C4-type zinc finger protein [Candidatus Kapabacteria bacterium]MCC6331825.1 TraR/DksA C4-type zinc finger protein [Ignavibacteria bacterium]MCL4277321.1 TraR/DksA C4-type zinc finger protein [Ignavibacteria bacterium]QOJ27132.1 MAG: TraR/DksA C4-type zinc finger protein [Ignavibacteria bacterium]WKZ78275.1 MAG: TraR/DksA C4-type zinc finger protein [Candidatus Kapabacteria bacterium]